MISLLSDTEAEKHLHILFTLLVVSWLACPDTRYRFLQIMYWCVFNQFWAEKLFFFRHKTNTISNGTSREPKHKISSFYDKKNGPIKLVQMDRQADIMTDLIS